MNDIQLSVAYAGSTFIGFSESELLKAGVPQDEINSVKKGDILSQREAAYKAESDPLYMEWQYDKTEEAEEKWRDKVAEIKARFPLSAVD